MDVDPQALEPKQPAPVIGGLGPGGASIWPERAPWWQRMMRPVAAVAAVALAAVVVFEVWDRHHTFSGGPVGGGVGTLGGPSEVGQLRTYKDFIIENTGRRPARLQRIRILGVTEGLEVIDVHTERFDDPDPPPVPAQSTGAVAGVAPLRGPLVLRGAKADTQPGDFDHVRLSITTRATRPGVARYRAVELSYRAGHRHYRRVIENAWYLCTPPEAFKDPDPTDYTAPPHKCPGPAEGVFDDASVTFRAP